MTVDQKKIIREVVIAWAIVIALSRLTNIFSHISLIAENASLITAVLLLYVPLVIFFKKKEKVDFLDHALSDFLKSFRLFLIFALILFPLSFIINHFYQNMIGHTYHPGSFKGWGPLIFYELVAIALPEEFFFRGYLQGRLNLLFEKKWKLLGAQIGLGLLLTSFIFAISHSLIQFQWWQILIFFPAMAFGWLKEKSHTITASIFLHASCNLFAKWVSLHY